MAFREYWQEHLEWDNPFDRIKVPKKKKGERRDVLGETEIVKLSYPGHARLKTTLGYLHTPEGKINEITKRIGTAPEGETG
jgi:hypothetical protein